MNFNPHECWDCPITALRFLTGALLGLAVVALSVWLGGRPGRFSKFFGAVFGAVAALWYVLGTGSVLKFGILYVFPDWYQPDDLRSWRILRQADLVVLACWYGITIWAWRIVMRRRVA